MRLLAGILAASLAAASVGCTRYEYEEDVFLGVDGSGSLRVSGSTELLGRLHDVEGDDPAAVRSFFDRDGFEVESVRRTRRAGRDYVHVQGEFERFSELCGHPAFAGRECDLDDGGDELSLRMSLAIPRQDVPDGVPGDALMALRFHFPSAVRFHNAERGVERGNILRWEQTAAEALDGQPFDVEARFERRSVLATTALVLGTALALVLLSATAAILWMYVKGRRQLAESARSAPVEPSRT